MTMSGEEMRKTLEVEGLPRSSRYDPEWMGKNEMGPNAVWLTEYLTQKMDLKANMRVLDMGCGKAISSIFLAREFAVQVWATDLWIKPTENWQRIKEAGMCDLVYPIHAEAHSLPYAENFFDAIISIDAYHYFGTDDIYFLNFAPLVKPGGQIGIVVPGLIKEFNGDVPEKLKPYWESELYSFHTPAWWKKHWERTGLVEIEVADNLPAGWDLWLKWENFMRKSGLLKRDGDTKLLEADGGEYLGFTRIVARRK